MDGASVTSLDRAGRKSLYNRRWHLNKDWKEREKTRWISGIRVNRQQRSIPGNSEEAIVTKVSKEKRSWRWLNQRYTAGSWPCRAFVRSLPYAEAIGGSWGWYTIVWISLGALLCIDEEGTSGAEARRHLGELII